MRRSDERGAAMLVSVLMVLVFLSIIVPFLVRENQQEAKWSTRAQKTSRAFALAQSAAEQALWKMKSSTSTLASVLTNNAPADYTFNNTFTDPNGGGQYRVRLTPTGVTRQVEVLAEGRDPQSGQVRAIRAVYTNISIPGAMLGRGQITLTDQLIPHWGPVMSQANIVLQAGSVNRFYPRKLARQVVTTNGVNPQRDPNTLSQLPNSGTDYVSGYDVPNLPRLDFDTMRAQAQTNGTLNIYSFSSGAPANIVDFDPEVAANNDRPHCRGWTQTATDDPDGVSPWTGHKPYSPPFPGAGFTAGSTVFPQDHRHPSDNGTLNAITSANILCSGGAPHTDHFVDSFHHPLAARNMIWYWDGDLVLTGRGVDWRTPDTCHQVGFEGTLIVRGDLTIANSTNDCLGGFAVTPSTRTVRDEYAAVDATSEVNYPGDAGGAVNVTGPYIFGTDNWRAPENGGWGYYKLLPTPDITTPSSSQGDVGVRGFVYVGGDLTLAGTSEIYGALWVEGTIGGPALSLMIFYDDNLQVPVLDVNLRQDSWNEVSPSTAAWANP